MAVPRTVPSGRSATLAALAAAVVLMASAGLAAAAPDPALCPFELGYNPSFNADGSILSCSKGQDIFQVDEAGILPTSLRGIGTSVVTILGGFISGDLTVFNPLVEADASLYFPGLGSVPPGPEILALLVEVFVFPPGVDKTAIFQISQYHFLSNDDPRTASVHITVFAAASTIDFDSVWHFNLVGGQRVWQLHSTANLVLVDV